MNNLTLTSNRPVASNDIATVKSMVSGRWAEVLSTLGGCPTDLLDGKHHPCPRCGGRDRFRLIDHDSGAVLCNQCFHVKNGDGIAALQWLRDWDFNTALKELLKYLEGEMPVTTRCHPRPEIIATYDYRDEDSRLLYQVVRYSPKGFRIRCPKPNGGWTYSMGNTRRVLYRLPEILTADPSSPVSVVEGEKDADRAYKIGLISTTCVAGAGKWRPDYSEYFRGRDVVIIPDNDAPGRNHAEQVAQSLHGVATSVKVVSLPDVPDKGDLSDWLDLGHGREELSELIAAAQVWQPASAGQLPMIVAEKSRKIPPYVPFPTDALPKVMADFIHHGSTALGCDESYIALPLLAMLASAIGNSRRIQMKNSWCEPAVIWAVVVGESGTLKSPALDLVMRPMQEAQAAAFANYDADCQEYARDKAIYEADMAEWRRKGRKMGDPPPVEPTEPIATRYLVSDCTVEALGELLSQQPRGLLVVRDELSGWLNGFDAYKNARGADVANWLLMYNANNLIIDRKSGRKTLRIPRAAVSVAGGIQPMTLAAALGGPRNEHFENGLAARMLLAMPPRVPKRWNDRGMPSATNAALRDLVGRLSQLDMPEDFNGNPQPIDIPLSHDGLKTWAAYYDAHAIEQVGMSGYLAAAWSKLEGYTARFALLIHLARAESNDPSLADPMAIDGGSVTAGVELSRWFGEEVVRVYAAIGSGTESWESLERRNVMRVLANEGGRITANDLRRRSRLFSTSEDAESALNRLEREGKGRWESSPPGPTGGRPTRYFMLNEADTKSETALKPEEATSFGNGDIVEESPLRLENGPQDGAEVTEWSA